MTCVAYRDGVIAADGLSADSDMVVSMQTVKIGRVGRLLWGHSGQCVDVPRFRSWLKTDLTVPPAIGKGSTIMIVMPDDAIYLVGDGGIEVHLGLPYFAIGSGDRFALGALAAGVSAEESVRHAARWSTAVGGKIRTLRR